MLPIRDPPQNKGHIQTESEGLEKDTTQIETKRKQEWQYSYPTKWTLKQRLWKDKEGHYIMIKGSIQEEDITVINIYASNIGAPQYVRQMLTSMKGEIINNIIIVGGFNTLLASMDRSVQFRSVQFSSFQSLSRVQFFATP